MNSNINIENVSSFHPDPNKVQVVVYRLTKRDNTPYNFVWIMGNIEKVRYKLFAIGKQQIERTYFGILYDARVPTDNIRIEVNTTRLTQLCHDLQIDSVVIVRFKIW